MLLTPSRIATAPTTVRPTRAIKPTYLLVVAHPDDEVMATAYLAREIYDNHKRVAVVYQTAGDEGNNDVGPEQAAALGDIRQIEGRRAVGSLGITNVWFLGGHDTVSQNVLTSLEHCGHGRCLDELVRIVRITQPSVILTWLPDFATGENHADHQASGVLATEAFDLAGDPTVFSEQVSPASNPDKNMNLTEGLRPWQPQKIYYFYNSTHDISSGQGPQYSSQEISPSRHVSYGMLAAEVFTNHLSQGGTKVANEIAGNTLGSSSDEIAKIATGPVQLIFGKSLVPSAVTDDVFTGVVPDGIAFQRAPGFTAPRHSEPTLEIGDPWSYYHKFWQAHGLDHLARIVPVEVSVHVDGTLVIPLIVENPAGFSDRRNLLCEGARGMEGHTRCSCLHRSAQPVLSSRSGCGACHQAARLAAICGLCRDPGIRTLEPYRFAWNSLMAGWRPNDRLWLQIPGDVHHHDALVTPHQQQ